MCTRSDLLLYLVYSICVLSVYQILNSSENQQARSFTSKPTRTLLKNRYYELMKKRVRTLEDELNETKVTENVKPVTTVLRSCTFGDSVNCNARRRRC